MEITKKEAKALGLEHGYICKFHDKYPDQDAIMNSCPDCKIIRDPCGCDEDSVCEICHPEEFKSEIKIINRVG